MYRMEFSRERLQALADKIEATLTTGSVEADADTMLALAMTAAKFIAERAQSPEHAGVGFLAFSRSVGQLIPYYYTLAFIAKEAANKAADAEPVIPKDEPEVLARKAAIAFANGIKAPETKH